MHFLPQQSLQNCKKMSCGRMPNIGDVIGMHNKAIQHQTEKKNQTVDKYATAEIREPVPFKKGAKKSRSCTRQPSCHEINQWYTTGAAKRSLNLDTITTNKASILKIKVYRVE